MTSRAPSRCCPFTEARRWLCDERSRKLMDTGQSRGELRPAGCDANDLRVVRRRGAHETGALRLRGKRPL